MVDEQTGWMSPSCNRMGVEGADMRCAVKEGLLAYLYSQYGLGVQRLASEYTPPDV